MAHLCFAGSFLSLPGQTEKTSSAEDATCTCCTSNAGSLSPRRPQMWWIWLRTWCFSTVMGINVLVCSALKRGRRGARLLHWLGGLVCCWSRWKSASVVGAYMKRSAALSEGAEVIRKPDGLETACARSKSSFSHQMFAYPASSEALVCSCERTCMRGWSESSGLHWNINGQHMFWQFRVNFVYLERETARIEAGTEKVVRLHNTLSCK